MSAAGYTDMRRVLLLFFAASSAWAALPNGYTSALIFTFNVHPAANLSGFPNLISGTYAQFADIAHGGYVNNTVTLNGQTVPADLIFTASDGSTLLSWEIERWNNTTGAIVGWVKSDRLAASDTLIYAYVGNSGVTTYQCTNAATWTGGSYTGVWHMPNGTTLSLYDSTTSGNNGTPGGTVSAHVGKMDGDALFDGSTGYVKVSAAPAGTFPIVESAWVKLTTSVIANNQTEIIVSQIHLAGSAAFYCGFIGTGSGNADFRLWAQDGGANSRVGHFAVTLDTNWHYYVAIWNSTTTQTLYIDGSPQTLAYFTQGTGAPTPGSLDTTYFGATYYNTSTFYAPLGGDIDEVRLTGTVPSAAWVAHEFAQQSQGSAWYIVSVPLILAGCPSSGRLGTPFTTCTVELPAGSTFDGVNTVTISDGGNLGTIAPSVGSVGQSMVTVTPANGASSFTFTYNPYLVGARIISVTATAWVSGFPFTYAVSSADVCTFTAKASGNWASASTWTASGCTGGGHTTPVSGDSVAMTAYHVTVPSGTTAYVGSCPANNTTYDLTIAPTATTDAVSGVLEVAGTLWLCGNIRLNASAVANPSGFGVLQIDTGGAMKWDLNNGSTAYRLVPGATGGWNQLIIGSANDACAFATESCPTSIVPVNLGSANPVLVDVNSTTDSMTYQIYGALVKNCGSASVGCINYATDSGAGRNNYANAGLVDIEGSYFDTTGNFQANCTGGYNNCAPVMQLTFKEDRFTNDLLPFMATGGQYSGGKTCTFSDVYFSSQFGNNAGGNQDFGGCALVGDVFNNGSFYQTNYPPSALHDIAVLNLPSPAVDNLAANAHDIYFSWTIHSGSVHGLSLGNYAEKLIGVVGESLDPNVGESHCTEDSAPGYTHIELDNLSVIVHGAGSNGDNSCTICAAHTQTNGTPGPVVYCDHNGANGHGYYQWILRFGHTGPYWPSNQTVRSVRSNIGYDTSVSSQNLAVNGNGLNGTTDQQVAPGAGVYTQQQTNNYWFNAASSTYWGTCGAGSVPPTGYCDSACNPSSSYGTPYSQCTTSGTPGVGDVSGTNPLYIDVSRGLYKWASVLHGQPANMAGAQAALIGCPNLSWCVDELLTYVRRGYQPTNVALKGKAYDGRIVGFAGSYGSGYSGTCGVTITPQDADDLGYGAAATCTFVGGVPSVQIANPGMHYRIATPATVAITGTCSGGCIAASLTPVISPHDPGPVPMVAFGRVE